ncbi:hypothetical protein E2C01_020289 [Portunus trituberculatus]|uniref:Uncharacterized protein n=1 Tax=Portunus trituberculatus TaxID=210409 RepID=A0A5B7E1B7_PORTR|nr:hypothetical protein [Portunus trituberculatus]
MKTYHSTEGVTVSSYTQTLAPTYKNNPYVASYDIVKELLPSLTLHFISCKLSVSEGLWLSLSLLLAVGEVHSSSRIAKFGCRPEKSCVS